MKIFKGINFILVCTMILSSLIGCTKDDDDMEGTTLISNLSGFKGVKLDDSFVVNIKKGKDFSVTAKGDTSFDKNANFRVDGDKLVLSLKENTKLNGKVTVEITLPSLVYLENNSSGRINVNSKFKEGNFEIKLEGSGTIEFAKFLELSNKLSVINNGSGEINLEGIAKEQEITLGSSGNVKGFFVSAIAIATNNSTGIIELKAGETLNATITDKGKIYYQGTPEIAKDIAEGGSLIDAN